MIFGGVRASSGVVAERDRHCGGENGLSQLQKNHFLTLCVRMCLRLPLEDHKEKKMKEATGGREKVPSGNLP